MGGYGFIVGQRKNNQATDSSVESMFKELESVVDAFDGISEVVRQMTQAESPEEERELEQRLVDMRPTFKRVLSYGVRPSCMDVKGQHIVYTWSIAHHDEQWWPQQYK